MQTNMKAFLFFLLFGVGFVPMVVRAQVPVPSSFITCISSAGSGNCELAPNIYTVPSELVVGRSNFTIRGTGATRSSTSLRRSVANLYPILRVPSGYSVAIENLEFDGYRAIFYGDCPPANLAVFDLQVEGSAAVSNVNFKSAPGHALQLKGGQLVGSSITWARSTGAFIYGSASVFSSDFSRCGTAAINIQGQGGVRVSGNLLWMNRYEMPDGQGGGQLFLELSPPSGYAIIDENTIDGNDWETGYAPINGCAPPPTPQTVGGVEAYGTGHSFYNNSVARNTSVGLGFTGVSNITVSGPNPYCPACSPKYVQLNGAFGIWFHTLLGQNTNVTLNHVRSVSNGMDGVNLDGVTGTGFINNACLSAPFGYNPFWVTNSTLTYPYPGYPGPVNILSCP